MTTPPARSALQTVQTLIAEGHAMEAAEYARMAAYALPEDEARAMLCALANAILDPVPRKRGDKFVSRETFEKLAIEVETADKVRDAIETHKLRSRPGRKTHVVPALDKVAKDPKSAISTSTAKRRYYKHK
jgi:hypothetical protein